MLKLRITLKSNKNILNKTAILILPFAVIIINYLQSCNTIKIKYTSIDIFICSFFLLHCTFIL